MSSSEFDFPRIDEGARQDALDIAAKLLVELCGVLGDMPHDRVNDYCDVLGQVQIAIDAGLEEMLGIPGRAVVKFFSDVEEGESVMGDVPCVSIRSYSQLVSSLNSVHLARGVGQLLSDL